MKYNSQMLALSLSLASISIQANTWTWGTEATYPPFEYTTPGGKIVGFDVDLMHSICNTLHQSCQLVNAPFASLIPSLNIGKFNAIIGGLAITSAREKVINFSHSYYKDKVIFVSKKPFKSIKPGHTVVGVQSGTTFQTFCQQFYPHTQIKTYNSNINALMDLQAGRINAVLIDEPVYVAWLQQHPKMTPFQTATAANTAAQKAALELGGNGIGMAKYNKTMLKKVNQALKTLSKNGTLKQLQKKWFHPHD